MVRRSVRTTSLTARPTPSLRPAALDGRRRSGWYDSPPTLPGGRISHCGGNLRKPSLSWTASLSLMPGRRPHGGPARSPTRGAVTPRGRHAICSFIRRGVRLRAVEVSMNVLNSRWLFRVGTRPDRRLSGHSTGAVRSRPPQSAREERAALGLAVDPGPGQAGMLRLSQQRDRAARLREHRARIVAGSARRGRRSRRVELIGVAATAGEGDQSLRRTAGR